MANLEHNPLEDAIYGIKNSAYTFDLLGRNKFGEAYTLNEGKSPRDSFFAMIEQWAFSMPLKSQWLLYIDTIPLRVNDGILASLQHDWDPTIYSNRAYSLKDMNDEFAAVSGSGAPALQNLFTLKNKSKNMLDRIEDRINELGDTLSNLGNLFSNTPKTSPRRAPSSIFGCRFIEEVSNLPSEEVGETSIQWDNAHAFQKPFISGGRKPLQPFELKFKEMNSSFVDILVRPWAIAVARDGLTAPADPREKLTTNIFIVEYSRAVNGKPSVPRKQWVLFNCCPISVETDSLKQTDDQGTWPVKSTKWAYTNYLVVNYHGNKELMNYTLPKPPSYFNRFIPGSVNRTIDSVLGQDGATSSAVTNTLPF